MHSTKASPAQADAVAAVLEEDALILTIMAHLGARDLATATTVCKAWARLEQEQEERLWERLALDAFGAGEGDGYLSGKPWKVRYRCSHNLGRKPTGVWNDSLQIHCKQLLDEYSFHLDFRGGEVGDDGAHKLICSVPARLAWNGSCSGICLESEFPPVVLPGLREDPDGYPLLSTDLHVMLFACRRADGKVLLLLDAPQANYQSRRTMLANPDFEDPRFPAIMLWNCAGDPTTWHDCVPGMGIFTDETAVVTWAPELCCAFVKAPPGRTPAWEFGAFGLTFGFQRHRWLPSEQWGPASEVLRMKSGYDILTILQSPAVDWT